MMNHYRMAMLRVGVGVTTEAMKLTTGGTEVRKIPKFRRIEGVEDGMTDILCGFQVQLWQRHGHGCL